MTIHYNVPGQERKALVSAVAKILDCEATYLGVPSCAYQVDEFTIDKDGNLVFSDMADSEIVEYLLESLHERGFDAVDPEDTGKPRKRKPTRKRNPLRRNSLMNQRWKRLRNPLMRQCWNPQKRYSLTSRRKRKPSA